MRERVSNFEFENHPAIRESPPGKEERKGKEDKERETLGAEREEERAVVVLFSRFSAADS